MNIKKRLMRPRTEQAARQGRTISELVDAVLKLFRDRKDEPDADLSPLPTWDFGGDPLVDIDDSDALYGVLDAERDAE